MILLISDDSAKCVYIERELKKYGYYVQTVFPYKNVTDRYNVKTVPSLIDESNNCLDYNDILRMLDSERRKIIEKEEKLKKYGII